ncbi:hypothetical protein [Hymenobacter guriensis]|uniref:PepSY domain-containing protein n=1 Tax=Hymenobacter guriensis TaxID=2793065 RepID=A0ABS0KXA0_9BACT|nr:hypothetical protein [Hymenobacter guriensis]MBG8552487.1 hypothetical protein [Hymenobacter guriensis]
MRTIEKYAVAAAVILGFSLKAQGQELPLPGQKNPDWVLQKTEHTQSAELLKTQPQPIPSPQLGGGTKSSAGDWEILYDPAHNVRYNLRAKTRGIVRVQNLQTGIVYTYTRAELVKPWPLK